MAGSIAHQAASNGVFPQTIDCGQSVAICQRHDVLSPGVEKRARSNEQRTDATLLEECKSGLNVAVVACLRNDELLPHRLRRSLHLPVLRLRVWKGRAHQRGNRRSLGHELTQQIKSLRPQSGAEKDHLYVPKTQIRTY